MTQATTQLEALVACQTSRTAFDVNSLPENRIIPEEAIRDAEELAQGYTATKQSPISDFSKLVNLRFVMKPKSIGLACSQLHKDEKLGLLTLCVGLGCSAEAWCTASC